MNSKISNKTIKQRIWELDFLRGLCVLLMMLDHTLFDLGFVFYRQWFPDGGSGLLPFICDFAANFYWGWPVRTVVRAVVLACFIGLCGLSCSFSRSNLKRGVRLLGVALLLTAATAAMDAFSGYTDFYIIRCGILHLLAASILVYAAIHRAGRPLLAVFGVALVAAGYYFQANPLDGGLIPYVLGLGGESYSADYFPLLPWMGFFLLGTAITGFLYRERKSYFPARAASKLRKPVDFLGRHALWAYVLHQPLIYGLLYALGALLV